MDLTSGAPFWIVRDGLPAVYQKLKQDLFLQRRNPDLEIFGSTGKVRPIPGDGRFRPCPTCPEHGHFRRRGSS